MSFTKFETEDQRLQILRLLDEGGDANESILHKAVRQCGHKDLMRDELLAQLRWLEAKKAVVLEHHQRGDSVVVCAEVTMYGRRLARGKEELDGVAKPGEV